ncbi:cytidylate kinase family protein [Candidatus Woesearchaeota archaeon]|nr:cytidylate kinase family protein [Candidatus Woesearchaeota archaeon]
MIITISGVSGSGKSSTAVLLAEKLNYKHYSMGDLQRKLAEKHGMTTVEFSKIESKDPKYDNERDNILKELGEKKDDFVIDGWLGAKFIPGSFKIFLDCDLDTRAKRIYEETKKGKNIAGIDHKRESDKKYSSVNDTKKTLLKKEKLNRERWRKYYNFDFMDKNNYDLVLDTTNLNINRTVNEILDHIKQIK